VHDGRLRAARVRVVGLSVWWEAYFAGVVGMAGFQAWKNTRIEMKYNQLSYVEIVVISSIWPVAGAILLIQALFSGLSKIDPR